MFKVYNNQKDFSIKFFNFLKKAIPNIRKSHLNILPSIIIGMILAESCVPADIAKVLKDDFSSIQFDSVVKRIRRFFNNKLFNPYYFYNKLIIYIINNFKAKHNDKVVYITFDHMFSKSNYTAYLRTVFENDVFR